MDYRWDFMRPRINETTFLQIKNKILKFEKKGQFFNPNAFVIVGIIHNTNFIF